MPGLSQMASPRTSVAVGLSGLTVTRVQAMPDAPDAQVAMTVGVMSLYAVEDSQDPEVRAQAADALREVGGDPNHYTDEQAVEAVWWFVKARLQFVHDDVTGAAAADWFGQPVIESVTRPRDIAGWGVGDCDDFATWGAALLLALGVACRFATVAADERAPGEYSHVYLVAYPVIDGDVARVPLDLSHGEAIGWETENKFGKLREWDLAQSAVSDASDGLQIAMAAAFGLGLMALGNKRRAA